MNSKECYEAGDLKGAIAAANDEVKSNPTDTSKRGFLIELLCFAGDLERVDKQLDALGKQDPDAMIGIAQFRHMVRAEQARQQFYTDGRMPEFLHDPSDAIKLHLEASIDIRDGKLTDAAKKLAEAEEKRPKLSGTCDGEKFADIRDLDDLTSPFIETLSSNGKYYWVPWENIASIDFVAPTRSRDLCWRQVELSVREGPDGQVFIPALYAGSHTNDDDKVRLGRVTDWVGDDGQPIRGIGQRTWLIGDNDRPLLELKRIEFDEPS